MSPLRIEPEELLRKIERIEREIREGLGAPHGISEPLAARAELTPFTPPVKPKHFYVVQGLVRVVSKTATIIELIGGANHINNVVISGDIEGEMQVPFSFALSPGEAWEWKTVTGLKPTGVFAGYFIW